VQVAIAKRVAEVIEDSGHSSALTKKRAAGLDSAKRGRPRSMDKEDNDDDDDDDDDESKRGSGRRSTQYERVKERKGQRVRVRDETSSYSSGAVRVESGGQETSHLQNETKATPLRGADALFAAQETTAGAGDGHESHEEMGMGHLNTSGVSPPVRTSGQSQ
jgi:hypothetical protein